VFGDRDGEQLISDPAWGALARRLYDAETAGWQPERLLAAVARQRELGTADSLAEVLCWRIDHHLPGQPPPAHLHEPSLDDARRYASLLSANQTLAVPAALTIQRHSGADDHAATVAAILGPTLAARVQSEPAWPALRSALQRTTQAGHDPAAVLTYAARTRELRTARSISEALAYRIGIYLNARPESIPWAGQQSHAVVDSEIWRTLAWTFKAAEDNGIPAETLFCDVRRARSLAHILAAARTRALPTRTDPDLPPWLVRPATPPRTSTQALARHLNNAAALITARVQQLAETAQREQPAWMPLLGQPPGDPRFRAQWLHHIGVIAAYRDQHQITATDHRQVLGPYIEPGRAGHTAYWHAVESIHAARHLAGPGPAIYGVADPARVQVAGDVYLALPDAEREHIRNTLATRLGPLWYGSQTETDDHAATRPIYARHLTALLAERSHLTQSPHHLDSRSSEEPIEMKQRTPSTQHRIRTATAPKWPPTARRPYGLPRPQQIPNQQDQMSLQHPTIALSAPRRPQQ
jgi:hypothetical protein